MDWIELDWIGFIDQLIVAENVNGGGGGLVDQMVWSPKSDRLAISFRGDEPGFDHSTLFIDFIEFVHFIHFIDLLSTLRCELIALFASTPGVMLSFHPMGFIRGPPSISSQVRINRPQFMQFRPQFDRGLID